MKKTILNRITCVAIMLVFLAPGSCYSQLPASELKLSGLTQTKIEIMPEKLVYKGKRLSDRRLKFLINQRETPESKEQLLSEFRKMKRYELKQKLGVPIGLLSGFAIVVVTSPLVTGGMDSGPYYSKKTWQLAFSGIIVGAIVRISSCIISQVNRIRRFQKRNDIAHLYNILN